ncbi:MAG: hypothetical protein HG447_001790 [Prevotella sp.]|nr:hypothetical protein [Prevotella sp.]
MEIFIIALWKLIFFDRSTCFRFFSSSFWDKRGLCGGRRIMCTAAIIQPVLCSPCNVYDCRRTTTII